MATISAWSLVKCVPVVVVRVAPQSGGSGSDARVRMVNIYHNIHYAYLPERLQNVASGPRSRLYCSCQAVPIRTILNASMASMRSRPIKIGRDSKSGPTTQPDRQKAVPRLRRSRIDFRVASLNHGIDCQCVEIRARLYGTPGKRTWFSCAATPRSCAPCARHLCRTWHTGNTPLRAAILVEIVSATPVRRRRQPRRRRSYPASSKLRFRTSGRREICRSCDDVTTANHF
jgi:hypothetical protein